MHGRSLEALSPRELRLMFRSGKIVRPTTGLAHGYAQANLLVLPQAAAFDFLMFCTLNPKPCPVLEVGRPGDPHSYRFAPGADIRYDLPLYRVYEGCKWNEVTEISSLWEHDSTFFLLGCSFSFEEALVQAGIPIRNVEQRRNCPMYITNIDCTPAGRFKGKLVVSMRPIPAQLVARAVEVTARFPRAHGSPIHIGEPESIGIPDLTKPDFGDPLDWVKGDVPVFWACGVTSQLAATQAGLPVVIAHAPGHLLIGDIRCEELAWW